MSKSASACHDVIVCGAGPAGLTLALALARRGAAVALVERHGPEALAAPEIDGRTTALAAGGRAVLEDLGVWPALAAEAAEDASALLGLLQPKGRRTFGRVLYSGGADKTVRVWSSESGEPLHELCGHSHWVASVRFSSDGARLASAS